MTTNATIKQISKLFCKAEDYGSQLHWIYYFCIVFCVCCCLYPTISLSFSPLILRFVEIYIDIFPTKPCVSTLLLVMKLLSDFYYCGTNDLYTCMSIDGVSSKVDRRNTLDTTRCNQTQQQFTQNSISMISYLWLCISIFC